MFLGSVRKPIRVTRCQSCHFPVDNFKLLFLSCCFRVVASELSVPFLKGLNLLQCERREGVLGKLKEPIRGLLHLEATTWKRQHMSLIGFRSSMFVDSMKSPWLDCTVLCIIQVISVAISLAKFVFAQTCFSWQCVSSCRIEDWDVMTAKFRTKWMISFQNELRNHKL